MYKKGGRVTGKVLFGIGHRAYKTIPYLSSSTKCYKMYCLFSLPGSVRPVDNYSINFTVSCNNYIGSKALGQFLETPTKSYFKGRLK